MSFIFSALKRQEHEDVAQFDNRISNMLPFVAGYVFFDLRNYNPESGEFSVFIEWDEELNRQLAYALPSGGYIIKATLKQAYMFHEIGHGLPLYMKPVARNGKIYSYKQYLLIDGRPFSVEFSGAILVPFEDRFAELGCKTPLPEVGQASSGQRTSAHGFTGSERGFSGSQITGSERGFSGSQLSGSEREISASLSFGSQLTGSERGFTGSQYGFLTNWFAGSGRGFTISQFVTSNYQWEYEFESMWQAFLGSQRYFTGSSLMYLLSGSQKYFFGGSNRYFWIGSQRYFFGGSQQYLLNGSQGSFLEGSQRYLLNGSQRYLLVDGQKFDIYPGESSDNSLDSRQKAARIAAHWSFFPPEWQLIEKSKRPQEHKGGNERFGYGLDLI